MSIPSTRPMKRRPTHPGDFERRGGGVCGSESLATSAACGVTASGGLPDARSPCRTAPLLTPPRPLRLSAP